MISGCNLKYVAQLEQGLITTSVDLLGEVVDYLRLDYE